MRRTGLLIAVALGATLVVPLVLGGNDALWQTLHFSVAGYLAIFSAIAISWFARAVKLYLLMHRLDVRTGFARTLAISLATDFAFISTPAGVGGYAASLYYLHRAGASAGSATTITAADQALDLLFFTVALPIAGLVVISSDLPQSLAIVGFGSSAIMIALVLGALLARRRLAAWLFGPNRFSRRWPRLQRLQETLRTFVMSLRNNASLLLAGGRGFIAGVFALTALQWLSRYGVLWLALLILGHNVPFAIMLLLQSLVLHAALWTGVPAGGGGAELGLSAMLAAWVPATSIATALLLWRLATLYSCLVVGAIAIAFLARQSAAQNAKVHLAHAEPAKDGAVIGPRKSRTRASS